MEEVSPKIVFCRRLHVIAYRATLTASPSKIGDIARAALVLTHFEHGYIT